MPPKGWRKPPKSGDSDTKPTAPRLVHSGDAVPSINRRMTDQPIYQPEPILLGTPPMRVCVMFKTALSQPGNREELDWPDGWPLPQHGDSLRLGDNAGFVTHITYDLAGRLVTIHTR